MDNNLTEKQKEMLIDFYISGYPFPTVDGYVFVDGNKRMDQRTCNALMRRNLVAFGKGSYFPGRGGCVASRIILTEKGNEMAEKLHDQKDN